MTKSKKIVKKDSKKVGKKNKVVTEEFLNAALEKQVSKTYLKKVLEEYPTKVDLKNELSNYPTKQELKAILAKELSNYATKKDLIDQTERVLTAFESATVDLHRLVGDIHTTHSHKYEDLDKRVEVLEIKINK